MPKLRVAPTRSNLLETKESLELAEEGHELLDQKREVLFMELMDLVHKLRELQEEAHAKFASAYEALESAIISMGKEEVERVSLVFKKTVDIDLIYRSVMGVPIPQIQASFSDDDLPLWTGLDDTNSFLDDTRLRFWELMQLIFQWGEIEIAIWRLTSEIRKTQRRVNALENIFIPEYEETIKLIEEILEENEREEFFRKKKVKKGKGKRANSRKPESQTTRKCESVFL